MGSDRGQMFPSFHFLPTYELHSGGATTGGDKELRSPPGTGSAQGCQMYLPAPEQCLSYCSSLLPLPLSSHRPIDIRAALRGAGLQRGGRSEKRPIPEEQKDERYYERRKKNNQAAKKSRDARRLREEQIVLRASMLEHENAILRAQVLTLREEAQSLRELLLHQKTIEHLDVCTI